jgi:hypothetical protein
MYCKYGWDGRETCSKTAVSGNVNEVCLTSNITGNKKK